MSQAFLLLIFPLIITVSASSASAAVPYQWIAKQYSEGLGRGPDSGGWTEHVTWFQQNGCNQTTLKARGNVFLTGPEFEGNGYNNSERVFVAYRAIFSREPDQGGFDGWLGCLNSGACTWPGVVNGFYDSGEFSELAPNICIGAQYQNAMGGNAPIPIGGQRSQAILQNQLYGGGVVCLNPQEVIYLTSTLVVPANASLVTCAAADRFRTARFGRLVRDSEFSGPLVETHGTIDRVWIDGQRGRFLYGPGTPNLLALAGTVTNSRIAEPLGWTNLIAHETCDGAPTVTNNLITSYTSLHQGGQWSDGLSISCSGTYVAGNDIIDPTDVGIVLFSRGPASGQNIVIENNNVVAAGRSAFGGFVVCDAIGFFNTPCTSSTLRFNQLWTSEFQHFDIGLSVGTQPWADGTATGGSAQNNVTPASLSIRVKDGIVVDGVLNTTVQSNGFTTITVQTGNTCPSAGGVSAHVSGGHASGSIQPFTERAVHGCVGHP
jgi:uncharacterized protein DUF4214